MWLEIIGKILILLVLIGLFLRIVKGVIRVALIAACVFVIFLLVQKGLDGTIQAAASVNAGAEVGKVIDSNPGIFGKLGDWWYQLRITLGI